MNIANLPAEYAPLLTATDFRRARYGFHHHFPQWLDADLHSVGRLLQPFLIARRASLYRDPAV
jgi:hypothetical protein